MSKYRSAVQLFKSMTQMNPIKRPNCEEILETRGLWAMDKNDFEINDELRHILEEKSKDNQSIYHIIQTKFKLFDELEEQDSDFAINTFYETY